MEPDFILASSVSRSISVSSMSSSMSSMSSFTYEGNLGFEAMRVKSNHKASRTRLIKLLSNDTTLSNPCAAKATAMIVVVATFQEKSKHDNNAELDRARKTLSKCNRK